MTGEHRKEGQRNISILHKQVILGIRQNTEITQNGSLCFPFLLYIVLPGKTVIQTHYAALGLHSKSFTRPCSESPIPNSPKISRLPNFPVSINYQWKLPFNECSSSQLIFLQIKSESEVLISGDRFVRILTVLNHSPKWVRKREEKFFLSMNHL